MSPQIPNAPRPSMAEIIREEVRRATEEIRRELEDSQRQIRELQGVDENVHQALGQVNERMTAKSGAYRELLGTVTATGQAVGTVDTRQSSFEAFVREQLGAVKAQVGSLVLRVPVTEKEIKQGAAAAVSASTSAALAESRSAQVVVAQTDTKIAIDGMRWKIIAGAIVSIVLGIATIAANTYVTLSRGDAIEKHIDERLQQAAPK